MRHVAEVWDYAVRRQVALRKETVAEIRMRTPLKLLMGTPTLTLLPAALSRTEGWERDVDGVFRRELAGGYITFDPATAELEIVAEPNESVAEGEARATISGTVEETAEAEATARYYDDGWDGSTASAARREAEANAVRKLAQARAERLAQAEAEADAADPVEAQAREAAQAALAEARAAARLAELERHAAQQLATVGMQARAVFQQALALAYQDAILAYARSRGAEDVELFDSGGVLQIEFQMAGLSYPDAAGGVRTTFRYRPDSGEVELFEVRDTGARWHAGLDARLDAIATEVALIVENDAQILEVAPPGWEVAHLRFPAATAEASRGGGGGFPHREEQAGEHLAHEYASSGTGVSAVGSALGQPVGGDPSAGAAGGIRRFLECRSPRNVRHGSQFAIVVKITEHEKTVGSAPILVPQIPTGGALLYVLLDAPAGSHVVTDAIVQVDLPVRGDSTEAWFLIQAPETTGAYRFTVTVLWAGVRGQVLAREPVVVEVSDKPTEPMDATMNPARSAAPDPMEAGLAVARISARRYLYFLNRPGRTPVHDILTMTADPRSQLKRLTTDLSRMARGGNGLRPAGIRDELRARGSDLWRDFLPRKVREALYDLRAGEDTLTIACANSTLAVPWEMMYPIDPIGGCSDFLVQLFDVVRSPESSAAWCPQFALRPAVIVLPDDQLPGAMEEAHAITEILGAAAGDRGYIREKVRLQHEMRNELFGLLHVAAHDRDGLGTISLAARQKFSPSDLNEFAEAGGRWSGQRPLVFVNACGTAGSRQRFTQFTSWAQSFFEAGAGGFIGSMWDVRSATASAFAQRFYQAIYIDGLSFSKALHQAREHSRSRGSDPTWLAYAAHGDHSATASPGR